MRWLLGGMVALMACDGPAPREMSDAGADASGDVYDRCERWQSPDLPCRSSPCNPGDQRVCSYDRVCQEWDDCVPYGSDAGPTTCVQCRYLFWCECWRY